MAKRHLTRRQQWRIDKIQEDRLKRAERQAGQPDEKLDASQLGAEQQGVVVARYGAQADVLATVSDSSPAVYRCKLRANLDSVVTGDKVVWRPAADESGIIVATVARESEFSRPDAHGNLRPIAANIDQVFIVIAPAPLTPGGLIDRYLVALEILDLPATILLNKADLLNDESTGKLQRLASIYQSLGYPLIHTSTKSAAGLDELKKALKSHTSVFVGQSGVGKSSLINKLLPDVNARVGELSDATGKGIHTTTTAAMFQLPEGGQVIDSPGIREFGLWHINAYQLAEGFIEFRQLLGQCRFRNCSHLGEPGCAIQQAFDEGNIAPERMSNFKQILGSI